MKVFTSCKTIFNIFSLNPTGSNITLPFLCILDRIHTISILTAKGGDSNLTYIFVVPSTKSRDSTLYHFHKKEYRFESLGLNCSKDKIFLNTKLHKLLIIWIFQILNRQENLQFSYLSNQTGPSSQIYLMAPFSGK